MQKFFIREKLDLYGNHTIESTSFITQDYKDKRKRKNKLAKRARKINRYKR